MCVMTAVGWSSVQEKTQGMNQMGMAQNCPMNVKGAEVATADTKDGISLTFTTKSGDIADLRRRVQAMAQMHSTVSSEAGMRGAMMIPFTAKYEEVPQGARLALAPEDAAKLAEFRAQVRKHVEGMKSGNCSMMTDMMKGMMGGMKAAETPPTGKPNEAEHDAHHPEGKK
jgi:hypothetical protein